MMGHVTLLTTTKMLLLSAFMALAAEGTVVAAASGRSDAFWAAVFGAVTTTLTAIATLIVGLRNSRKADEIKDHTNSINSTLQSSLRDATTRIELLERLLKSREALAAASVVAVDKAVAAALSKPQRDVEQEQEQGKDTGAGDET